MLLLSVGIILAFLAFLGSAWLALLYKRSHQVNKHGIVTVKKILARTSNKRGLNHYENVKIDGVDTVFENVIVGPFGVLVVNSLPTAGAYFGTRTEDTWLVGLSDGTRVRIPNPLLAIDKGLARLQILARPYNLGRFQTYSSICLTGKPSVTYAAVSDDLVFTMNELYNLLFIERFVRERVWDWRGFCKLLESGKFEPTENINE